MPRRATKPTEEPDAVVWRNDDGDWGHACAHCDHITFMRAGRDRAAAYDDCALHLWARHSKRRVWIKHMDPEYAKAVQLAMPLAIKLHHAPNN